MNYQGTPGAVLSSLTLTGGSLHVAGPTVIGRAASLVDASNINGMFYQTGGTATLGGVTTVGYNGTAASYYEISGGVLNANGGVFVGGNPTNNNAGMGNGEMDISGSAVVNISGGQGLVIGQDRSWATAGNVNLSGGALSITGNVTLGNTLGGGIGTLYRSGGALTVSGSLSVYGNATIILDSTTGNVATSFSKLGRTSPATLVVVPQTGNLATTEAIYFTSNPGQTSGILGCWAVGTLPVLTVAVTISQRFQPRVVIA